MKKFVEYELADGNKICVEVDEPQPAGARPVSKVGDAAEKAKELFEDALGKIKPATKALVATLQDLGPDEATVEFGVKLSTKAGIVIASADKEVNFVFKLTWKRQPELSKS
jgi:hypothetical protein